MALFLLCPHVDGRKFVIHANNAQFHTAGKYRALRIEDRLSLTVHPWCSRDLDPSDFFLFARVKHCPQGMTFPSHEELYAAIREISTDIGRAFTGCI
jgi:hypothetical protein